MNEWRGSIHDKDLLFGTDGDRIVYLRAGLHAAPDEAVGHLNNLSNTVWIRKTNEMAAGRLSSAVGR